MAETAKLPRYVAFKGHNDKFLAHYDTGNVYLQFNVTDFANAYARHEVVPAEDGNVRIKCLKNNKYWRRSPNWIWADTDNPDPSNKDCLFQPVAVDSKTVALKCLANNRFLIPLTTEGKVGCLNAASDSATTEARMVVVEPVLKRRVHSVVYDLDAAEVYDKKPLVLGTRKAVNKSAYKADVAMSFAYTQTKTSTWNVSKTITCGVEASVTAGVPLVESASITISLETSVTTELGKTVEESKSLVDTYTVKDLPPEGSVTVKLSGTNAECNVRFRYIQEDTLVTGEVVKTELDDGIFKGVNLSFVDWQSSGGQA